MESKKFYHSRTLWVNFIALVALIAQLVTGQEWLDVEAQVGILATVNLVLRVITSQGITL